MGFARAEEERMATTEGAEVAVSVRDGIVTAVGDDMRVI